MTYQKRKDDLRLKGGFSISVYNPRPENHVNNKKKIIIINKQCSAAGGQRAKTGPSAIICGPQYKSENWQVTEENLTYMSD